MITKVNNWLNIIQYSLLPASCILCGNKGMPHKDLCFACHKALIKMGNHCYCCAQSLPLSGQLCGLCQSTPPAFDRTFAPFMHQGEIRYLINQLKFHGAYKHSHILGLLLAEHIAKTINPAKLIIPVPLHPIRYRQRGFNQTLEIAKTISKELSIPFNNSCCQRRKNTPHQISLTAKQRHKNIKNAFQVVDKINTPHIAILDDVFTTGATVNELAKTLKASGVKQVDIWVCARAPSH